MQKHFKIALLFMFLGVFIPITISIFNTSNEKMENYKRIRDLPDFNLITLDNIVFDNSSLKEGKKIVLYFFNSTCDLCARDLANLYTSKKKDHDTQILVISNESLEIVKRFKEKKLNTISDLDIHFLIDHGNAMFTIYEVDHTPQLYPYNEQNKLESACKEETMPLTRFFE